MTILEHSLIAKTRGFTLVEMAVVLFIFGLLIAGVIGPLETQLEARDRNSTIATMNEVIEALYGYAITHGRLPCPDTDGDGLPDMTNEPYDPSDVDTGACDGDTFNDGEGFLPWAELGVAQGDAWGNRFRYRVTWPNFTWPDHRDPPGLPSDRVCDGDIDPEEFDLCASGNLLVQTRGDNPGAGGIQGKFLSTLANNLPAILLSHGRNGFGATSTDGAARPLPASGTDEAENADGDTTFISRRYSGDNATCADNLAEASALCAFDDIVMWISPSLLNNRMVVAGRLP
ncbi:MAG: prepilin-type N-terminal cleavage/methylation domain-containing protein [Proteobacteria bacterium]|nr:prepilin-type N-terminal cleavage/methylation domain-containing protein [Pseudomonadota bacterium]